MVERERERERERESKRARQGGTESDRVTESERHVWGHISGESKSERASVKL